VRDSVQVVQECLVFELVYFVQDGDIRCIVGVAEAVEQDVFRCGLTVDVYGLVNAVEESVQGFESGVVFPAVDVLVVEVHDGFAELFDEVLCDAGFPGSGWAVEECWVGSVPVGDGVENAGEVVDFGVAVLHLLWDEFWLENPCVCDHESVSTGQARVIIGRV